MDSCFGYCRQCSQSSSPTVLLLCFASPPPPATAPTTTSTTTTTHNHQQLQQQCYLIVDGRCSAPQTMQGLTNSGSGTKCSEAVDSIGHGARLSSCGNRILGLVFRMLQGTIQVHPSTTTSEGFCMLLTNSCRLQSSASHIAKFRKTRVTHTIDPPATKAVHGRAKSIYNHSTPCQRPHRSHCSTCKKPEAEVPLPQGSP